MAGLLYLLAPLSAGFPKTKTARPISPSPAFPSLSPQSPDRRLPSLRPPSPARRRLTVLWRLVLVQLGQQEAGEHLLAAALVPVRLELQHRLALVLREPHRLQAEVLQRGRQVLQPGDTRPARSVSGSAVRLDSYRQ